MVGSASFFLVWDVFSQTVVGEKIEWLMHLCTPVLKGMFIAVSSLFSVNKLVLVPVLKVPQIKKVFFEKLVSVLHQILIITMLFIIIV